MYNDKRKKEGVLMVPTSLFSPPHYFYLK